MPSVSVSAPGAGDFERRFRHLILLAWSIPPVFGLGFILFIGVLSWSQLRTILLTPLEPAFILLWAVFAWWYFSRYARPIADHLAAPSGADPELALDRMRHFPLHFWSLFLFYLLLAPASVIPSSRI